jgi:molybdopterin converting factor small subunit
VKIVFYGRLADVIGPELEVRVPPDYSVSQLRDRLAVEHPAAEQDLRDKRVRTCIGDRLVHDDHALDASDVVEFLPPVSGG